MVTVLIHGSVDFNVCLSVSLLVIILLSLSVLLSLSLILQLNVSSLKTKQVLNVLVSFLHHSLHSIL